MELLFPEIYVCLRVANGSWGTAVGKQVTALTSCFCSVSGTSGEPLTAEHRIDAGLDGPLLGSCGAVSSSLICLLTSYRIPI